MKRNVLKLVSMILCAAMLFCLAACDGEKPNGNQGGEPGEAVTVTGPITIEFWHTRTGDQGAMLANQIKKFNETNTLGITVVGTYQGSYYDVLGKVKTAWNSDMSPAMCLVGAGGIEELAEGGALADMSAYVERDNWDLNNIPESLRYYTEHYEGQVIEFPYLVSSAVIYYNKDYFTSEPKTLEEQVEMAKQITAKNPGIAGMALALDTGYIQRPILMSLGAPGLTTNGGKSPALLDDGTLVKHMTDWKSWIDAGFCASVDAANSSTIMKNDFITGKLASYTASSAGMNDMVKDCLAAGINLGVAKFVGYGGYCAPIGGGGICVLSNATSQEIAASWEFIKFLYEDEQVIENSITSGYLPYTVSAAKNEKMVSYWNENPLLKVAYDQLEYATYNDWSIHLEQWRDKIALSFSDVITSRLYTPEEAVEILRQQSTVIFK